MKTAIVYVTIDGDKIMFDIILETNQDNKSANVRLQVLSIYPANRGLLPAYRHDISINPAME
jgi:hypothetical protein